jgi:manganese-dependent inorganic pyrophosphatase
MIELAKIADVNYHDYGFEMFKAGTSLDGLTKEEIIRSDLKSFNIDEQFIGVGQVFTLDIEKINKDKDKYIDIIEEIKVKNNYKFVAIFITDII